MTVTTATWMPWVPSSEANLRGGNKISKLCKKIKTTVIMQLALVQVLVVQPCPCPERCKERRCCDWDRPRWRWLCLPASRLSLVRCRAHSIHETSHRTFWVFMYGSTCCTHAKALTASMLSSSFNAAVVSVSTVPLCARAALCTRTVGWPRWARTSAKAREICASSAMSAWICTATPPFCKINQKRAVARKQKNDASRWEPSGKKKTQSVYWIAC